MLSQLLALVLVLVLSQLWLLLLASLCLSSQFLVGILGMPRLGTTRLMGHVYVRTAPLSRLCSAVSAVAAGQALPVAAAVLPASAAVLQASPEALPSSSARCLAGEPVCGQPALRCEKQWPKCVLAAQACNVTNKSKGSAHAAG